MWKDSETELDFLDFDYLIEILKDIIEDESLLPSSIGVYGDWGSGKSSLTMYGRPWILPPFLIKV